MQMRLELVVATLLIPATAPKLRHFRAGGDRPEIQLSAPVAIEASLDLPASALERRTSAPEQCSTVHAEGFLLVRWIR